MQSVNSLLTQQLTEIKNKGSESLPSSSKQFKNLPQTVAAILGSSLLAEHCGFKSVGSSSHQLALSCYSIAEAMPQDSVIATPNGQALGRLDYYQAAANLSPNTKIYWLKLAETLGDNETIKVGQKKNACQKALRCQPWPCGQSKPNKLKQAPIRAAAPSTCIIDRLNPNKAIRVSAEIEAAIQSNRPEKPLGHHT